MEKWDQRFLALAKHVAEWSKDPRTKVGSVIVGFDKRQVAFGFNGFPPGVADTEQRLNDRATKYVFIQHAERNALDNATFDTRESTLYATMFPCSSCAKSIISKGVRAVVAPRPSADLAWRDDAQHSLLMFSEAGVLVKFSD